MISVAIPMAGLGSRFRQAGYENPKPFIDVGGTPMIIEVLENLLIDPSISNHVRYIFLYLKEFEGKEYFSDFQELVYQIADERLNEGQSIECRFVPIETVTQGAACTVLLAEDYIANGNELIIANSDQLVLDPSYLDNAIRYFRRQQAEGGIICFWADSPKWSYCRISDNKVTEVVEKQVVSNFATIGIYYFAEGNLFVNAAHQMIDKNIRVNGEFYTAPSYNQLIIDGNKVVPFFVNSMYGLGTPSDLEIYLKEARSA